MGLGTSPAPRNRTSQHQELELPTIQMGQPIPVLFGSQNCKGVVIFPDKAHIASNYSAKKAPGAGGGGGSLGGGAVPGAANAQQEFFINFAIAYGWGVDVLYALLVDDKPIFDTVGNGGIFAWGVPPGQNQPDAPRRQDLSPNFLPITAHAAKGGQGNFYLFPGATDAEMSVRMQGFTGDEAPPYRGLFYIVYGGDDPGGGSWNVGSTARVPNITAVVFREPRVPFLDISRSIQTGPYADANPIAIVCEALTNDLWGAGWPIDRLDIDSCNEAGAFFSSLNPGWGLSTLLTTQVSAENFANDVLRHVDAGFVKRSGNRWGIRLAHKAFSFGADMSHLPLLRKEAVGEDYQKQAGQSADAINAVDFEFSDQRRNFSVDSFPVVDAASVLSLDNVRKETLRIPFVTCLETALAVAQYKTRLISIPRDLHVFTLQQSDAIIAETQADGSVGYRYLEFGDVIRVEYPKGGLTGDEPLRVVKLERTPLSRQGYLKVTVLEEVGPFNVFQGDESVPVVDTAPPGPLLEPPPPIIYFMGIELPWDYHTATPAEIQLSMLAAASDNRFPEFVLYGGLTPDVNVAYEQTAAFLPHGLIEQGPTFGGMQLDKDGLVIRANPDTRDLQDFAAVGSVQYIELLANARLAVLTGVLVGGNVAYEVIAFQEIIVLDAGDADTGPSYRLKNIIRARFDTAQLASPVNCFILPDGLLPFMVSSNEHVEFANGRILYVKAAPYNSVTAADPSTQDLGTLALVGRANRPYSPGEARLNDAPQERRPVYTAGDSVRIQWVARRKDAGFNYVDPTQRWTNGLAFGGTFEIDVYDGADAFVETIATGGTAYVDGFGGKWLKYDYTTDAGWSQFTAKIYQMENGLRSLAASVIIGKAA